MNCDQCGAETGVLDSRKLTNRYGQQIVKHRRHCLECGARFRTYERRALQDGSAVHFDNQLASALEGLEKAVAIVGEARQALFDRSNEIAPCDTE